MDNKNILQISRNSILHDIFVSPKPAQATAGTTPTPAATAETKVDRSQLDAKGGFASIGHELDETAPLWRVYRDEVRNHDQNVTLDEWNKTLDVLLIFAGLFSAVVTTFVVTTVPLLNPQDDDVALAIYALARSIKNDLTLPAPEPAGPATLSSLWVNGLWFTSLFVALAVAFFAILAKQWLVEYNHRMADPPATASAATALSATTAAATTTPTASLTWARRRNFFFEGFDKWHIPALVTQVLPFLLHIALFLFLVGLAVFVWTLNRRIAFTMVTLTGVLIGLYIVSTLLPMWWWDCPTATPLVRQLRGIPALLVAKVLAIFDTHSGPVLPLRVTRAQSALGRFMRRVSQPEWNDQEPTALPVTCRTLRWLILVSGSESATTTALQSLGTLDPDSIGWFLPDLQRMTSGMSALSSLQAAPTAVEVIRAIRSELVLGRGLWTAPLLGLDLTPAMLDALRSSYWPDAQLLWAALNAATSHSPGIHRPSTPVIHPPSTPERAEPWLLTLRDISAAWIRTQTPPSLPSTALLLMRAKGMPPRILPYLLALLVTDRSPNEDSDRLLRLCNIAGLGCQSPCPVQDSPGHGSTCDLSCVVLFVCRTVDTRDDTACRIGAWLGAQLLRKYGGNMALHNLRPLREFLSDRQASDKLRTVLEGKSTTPAWLHRGVLMLLSASQHDHAIEPVVHILDPEGRRFFLEFLLELERKCLKAQFVLSPEIWIALLVGFSESPPGRTFTADELSLLLEGAYRLKSRNHADRTVVAILDDQIHLSQATIARRDVGNPLFPLTVSSALPDGDRFASTPPRVIESLLGREMRVGDGKYVLSSELWLQVLTTAAKELSPDTVSPRLLVPLFAGASMLNRRTGSVENSLVFHLCNRLHDWKRKSRPYWDSYGPFNSDSEERLFEQLTEFVCDGILRMDMTPSRLNMVAGMTHGGLPLYAPVEDVQVRGRFAPLAEGYTPVVGRTTSLELEDGTIKKAFAILELTQDEIRQLPADDADTETARTSL